jgi:hypothetical protein
LTIDAAATLATDDDDDAVALMLPMMNGECSCE